MPFTACAGTLSRRILRLRLLGGALNHRTVSVHCLIPCVRSFFWGREESEKLTLLPPSHYPALLSSFTITSTNANSK